MNYYEYQMKHREFDAYKQFTLDCILDGVDNKHELLREVLDNGRTEDLPIAGKVDSFEVRSRIRKLRNLRDEIVSDRVKMRQDERLSLRSKAISSTERHAKRAFAEFEGNNLSITVDAHFKGDDFDEPYITYQGTSVRGSHVRFHVHVSWARTVGREFAFMMYGGNKTFVLGSTQIDGHALEGNNCTVHEITVCGERTQAAIGKDIQRVSQYYTEAVDEGDLSYAENLRKQIDELRENANRMQVYNLYQVVSTEHADQDNVPLRGVGTSADAAHKLLQRRIRDTFVKELEF